MLCYWILRRPDNSPTGLVRVLDDRVTLKPSGTTTGTFTLFSAIEAVPIMPESETYLCGAEAVLGTENGRVTCFAAAEHAASLAQYRERMSRICTNKGEQSKTPMPEPAKAAPVSPKPEEQSLKSTIYEENAENPEGIIEDISQINTKITDSVSDTARETEAFSELLRRADAFYAAYEQIEPADTEEDMVQKEDNMEGGIDLFPQQFPGARWRYVDGADVLPHYEGTWTQRDGETVRILAVRGRAAPRPPRPLMGFSRYLRDRDGFGYWVKTTVLQQ